METIILGAITLVLFIITWILIVVNSVPDNILPLDSKYLENKYRDTFSESLDISKLKYQVRDLDSTVKTLTELVLSSRSNPHPINKTPEQILRELPNNNLIQEARRRSLLEFKETLK